jgi:hypothetical protein
MSRSLRLTLAAAMLAALASPVLAGDGVVYEGAAYEGHHHGANGVYYGGTEQFIPGVSPWHAGYYHVMWGRPLAAVVPPTLTHQTNWGWGVGNTRVTPIYPQYVGPLMATSYGGYETYRPTPFYVSDTLQFGVYYIRGPW